MDEPNLVARLVALNERTRKAWAHPHNRSYYVPASYKGIEVRERASRESTPSNEDTITQDTEPELRLYLNNRPKDIRKGWVFGSDKTACDIYCGDADTKSQYNIGRQTFSITLNEECQVILKHLRNTNWTQVRYDDQSAGARGEFVYIMLPYCQNIYVCSAKELKFQVEVVQLRAQTKLCMRLRSQFLMDVEKSTPPMPVLSGGSGSWMAATSLVSATQMQPFYYIRKDRMLGKGSFGKVYIVVDVSTGVEYAGKTFNSKIGRSEAEILANQKHANILRYVTLSNNDGPLLVTEYHKEGTLARPWKEKDRTMWEIHQIVSILAQSLRALAILHDSPNPVIHRDLKPSNILVAYRAFGPDTNETGPWIKLADFGIAVEGTKCHTERGTWIYTAPEVFGPGRYSSEVDIWSLGVVIVQLLLEGNIPESSGKQPRGTVWCKDIIANVLRNCWACQKQDERDLLMNERSLKTFLWNFLRLFMLRYDPKERLSAQGCLDHELFQQMHLGSRSVAGWRERPVYVNGKRVPSTLNITKQFKKPGVPLSGSKKELQGYSSLISPSKMQNKKAIKETYDPGVELAVALENQGSKGLLDGPIPIGFGLVLEDHDNDATGELA